MESALNLWRRRANEAWITGVDPAALRVRLQQRQAALNAGNRVWNLESDPIDFVAGVLAAVSHQDPVELFLGSDRWTECERTAAFAIARPHVVWGETDGDRSPAGGAPSLASQQLIMVPSGGTTGGLRFAAHTWESLGIAAHGLRQWLGGGAINSVCFLPLHHVSGLMQLVRSLVTDGNLTLADWSEIECGKFPSVGDKPAVTSLVPTQLERLRRVPGGAAWLRQFRCVFLGGACADAAVLAWARQERIPLAPGYGMTETAAQVATMRPEKFLAGEPIAAEVLPHAEISVIDEAGGQPVSVGTAGRLVIRSAALFRGYYPECAVPRTSFATGDRGVLDLSGRVSVLGRLDTIINTGGEKVDPAEVEQAILATGLVQAAVVFGAPDNEWGEIVVATIVGATAGDGDLMQHLREQLTGYKLPKRWLRVEALPENSSGKTDFAALRALVR